MPSATSAWWSIVVKTIDFPLVTCDRKLVVYKLYVFYVGLLDASTYVPQQQNLVGLMNLTKNGVMYDNWVQLNQDHGFYTPR